MSQSGQFSRVKRVILALELRRSRSVGRIIAMVGSSLYQGTADFGCFETSGSAAVAALILPRAANFDIPSYSRT